MEHIDYTQIYKLQDEVLQSVFETEREFYLTGGTCISRFYVAKRYSDDLDFFTNQSPRYSFAVKNIKRALQGTFELAAHVEAKDFTRFFINGVLQVDFANDSVPRYKEPIVTKNNFIIDNIENILVNKMTAIIGRDNPKDIFDIFLICKLYTFNWKEILEAAHRRAKFDDEELIIRLKTFPKELLRELRIIDNTFLDDFDVFFPKVINDIERTMGV